MKVVAVFFVAALLAVAAGVGVRAKLHRFSADSLLELEDAPIKTGEMDTAPQDNPGDPPTPENPAHSTAAPEPWQKVLNKNATKPGGEDATGTSGDKSLLSSLFGENNEGFNVHKIFSAGQLAGLPTQQQTQQQTGDDDDDDTSASAPQWSYKTGGKDWEGTCAIGKKQSPVDLPFAQLAPASGTMNGAQNEVTFQLKPMAGRKIRHTGTTIEVDGLGLGTATTKVTGDVYEARRIVYHAPSEHTIDGKHADAEAQVVFQKHDSSGDQDLLVVAVLFTKGQASAFLDSAGFRDLPAAEGETSKVAGEVDLSSLITKPSDSAYFTYVGSLTQPACSEGVIWRVAQQPATISEGQLGALNALFADKRTFADGHGNNREVQPLNGRTIVLSTGPIVSGIFVDEASVAQNSGAAHQTDISQMIKDILSKEKSGGEKSGSEKSGESVEDYMGSVSSTEYGGEVKPQQESSSSSSSGSTEYQGETTEYQGSGDSNTVDEAAEEKAEEGEGDKLADYMGSPAQEQHHQTKPKSQVTEVSEYQGATEEEKKVVQEAGEEPESKHEEEEKAAAKGEHEEEAAKGEHEEKKEAAAKGEHEEEKEEEAAKGEHEEKKEEAAKGEHEEEKKAEPAAEEEEKKAEPAAAEEEKKAESPEEKQEEATEEKKAETLVKQTEESVAKEEGGHKTEEKKPAEHEHEHDGEHAATKTHEAAQGEHGLKNEEVPKDAKVKSVAEQEAKEKSAESKSSESEAEQHAVPGLHLPQVSEDEVQKVSVGAHHNGSNSTVTPLHGGGKGSEIMGQIHKLRERIEELEKHNERLSKLESVVLPNWSTQEGSCPDGWKMIGYVASEDRVHCEPPEAGHANAPGNPSCHDVAKFPRMFDRCGWSMHCRAPWKRYHCYPFPGSTELPKNVAGKTPDLPTDSKKQNGTGPAHGGAHQQQHQQQQEHQGEGHAPAQQHAAAEQTPAGVNLMGQKQSEGQSEGQQLSHAQPQQAAEHHQQQQQHHQEQGSSAMTPGDAGAAAGGDAGEAAGRAAGQAAGRSAGSHAGGVFGAQQAMGVMSPAQAPAVAHHFGGSQSDELPAMPSISQLLHVSDPADDKVEQGTSLAKAINAEAGLPGGVEPSYSPSIPLAQDAGSRLPESDGLKSVEQLRDALTAGLQDDKKAEA